jgi:hypothetical protein
MALVMMMAMQAPKKNPTTKLLIGRVQKVGHCDHKDQSEEEGKIGHLSSFSSGSFAESSEKVIAPNTHPRVRITMNAVID